MDTEKINKEKIMITFLVINRKQMIHKAYADADKVQNRV